MKKTACVLAIAFIAAAYSAAWAEISVVSVKGEFSGLVDGRWLPLAPGAKLAEGTKVSTGINSIAVIRIDSHLLTIGPVSSVKLYRNASAGASSDTSVGVQYGTVRAKVKKLSTVKTRFNITTPVATSSVRGTEEIVSYGPASGMKVEIIDGTIYVGNDSGVSNVISGRQRFALAGRNARPDAVNAYLKGTVVVIPAGASQGERDAADRSGGEDLVLDKGRTPVTGTTHVNIRLGGWN